MKVFCIPEQSYSLTIALIYWRIYVYYYVYYLSIYVYYYVYYLRDLGVYNEGELPEFFILEYHLVRYCQRLYIRLLGKIVIFFMLCTFEKQSKILNYFEVLKE